MAVELSQSGTPKRKRRWLQYSLRTFLLLVAVFSVWLAIQVNKAQKQRAAVAAVEKVGGIVVYDYMREQYAALQAARRDIRDAVPPGPLWLRKLIGDEHFMRPVGLTFYRDATDDDVEQALALDDITELNLSMTKVSDDGLRHLAELESLEVLALSYTNISDDGLAHLRNVPTLQRLHITNTGITDAGLQHLADLKHLELLHVYRTNVTPQGIAELQQKLPGLTIYQ